MEGHSDGHAASASSSRNDKSKRQERFQISNQPPRGPRRRPVDRCKTPDQHRPSCEQQAPRWRPTKWRPTKWRRARRWLPFGELAHLPFGELLCEQSAQIKVNSDAYSITAQVLTGPLLFPEPRMRTTRPASDQRPTERRQRRNSHRLAGEAGGENICRQPPPQPLRQRRFRAGGGR